MQSETIIIYERVLKGELWPAKYIGTSTTVERSIEIIRYLFFEKLQIYDYKSAKAILNDEFIEKYKLKRIIRYIFKPPELLPSENDHILWILFPEKEMGKNTLIIKVFKDVMARRRKTFPRGYFNNPDEGRYRAAVCFKFLCRKVMHLSGEKIVWEFCHSDGIKKLSKYHLSSIVGSGSVYVSLSELLEDVYPQYYSRLSEFQEERDKRHKRRKRKENGNS